MVTLGDTGAGYETLDITAELVLVSSDYPASAAFEMYIAPASRPGSAESLVVTVTDLETGEISVQDLGDALLGSGASLYWSTLCRGTEGCAPFRFTVDVATDTDEALSVQFQAYAELPVCEAIDGDFEVELELVP